MEVRPDGRGAAPDDRLREQYPTAPAIPASQVAETRADQLVEAFLAFHRANPEVWKLFERFALAAIQAGRRHYSSNAIFERIRWHIEVETGGEVKLNNNFRAYYARMFHAAHPAHDGFFRNRRLVSLRRRACDRDIQVWDSGEPVDEGGLKERMNP